MNFTLIYFYHCMSLFLSSLFIEEKIKHYTILTDAHASIDNLVFDIPQHNYSINRSRTNEKGVLGIK